MKVKTKATEYHTKRFRIQSEDPENFQNFANGVKQTHAN